jgi:hypothetical protein
MTGFVSTLTPKKVVRPKEIYKTYSTLLLSQYQETEFLSSNILDYMTNITAAS